MSEIKEKSKNRLYIIYILYLKKVKNFNSKEGKRPCKNKNYIKKVINKKLLMKSREPSLKKNIIN